MAIQSVPQGKKNSKKSNLITLDPTWESALNYLNERYVFVEQLAKIVRIPTSAKPGLDIYPPATFTNALEAPLRVNDRSVARFWLNWNHRRSVYKLEYSPGRSRFNSNNLNTWMESSVKPIKGDVSLFLDYLDRIFASDPTYRDWFLAWAAYPLQNPGVKLHTAIIFWSEMTATGKSMFGKIMSNIYGAQNYAQLDESTLHNPFNFWANGRQFVMGEEIRGASSEKYADKLKAMITQQVVYVNLKQIAQFELRDCLNYYFTSNHQNAFYLDPNDRRLFVHNVGDRKYPADKYRDEFEPWTLNGGHEAIRWYLENEIDLSKPIVGGDPTSLTPHQFNPGAAAPQSNARKAMILANRDDAEEWIDDLIECPQNVLCGNSWTLATAPDLYELFLNINKRSKIGPKAFAARLRSRIPSLYSDNKLTLSDGKMVKIYSVNPSGRSGKERSAESIVSDYEREHAE